MHDWKKVVRERLEMSALSSACREEIVTELATHLEEIYAAARAEGAREEAAVEIALQEVRDWRVLASRIRRAQREDNRMNYRTKSLWLPGLLTLTGSSVSLAVIQLAGIHPSLVWTGHAAMCFYWPWLLTLPLFGGLGAYVSQRASGSIRARLVAAFFPALVVLIPLLVILPVALVVDGFDPFRFFVFGLAVTNWVGVPAVALLVGAAPFLREANAGRAEFEH